MDKQFDSTRETRNPPPYFSGSGVYRQVKDVRTVLGKQKRGVDHEGDDDGHDEGIWNKKFILQELEYWHILAVRHSIDTVHLKKNICESLISTIMNTKGKGKHHENARADLEEMGIRRELYVQEAKNGKDLPVAATTMSRKEKKELCKILYSVNFPQDTVPTLPSLSA